MPETSGEPVPEDWTDLDVEVVLVENKVDARQDNARHGENTEEEMIHSADSVST